MLSSRKNILTTEAVENFIAEKQWSVESFTFDKNGNLEPDYIVIDVKDVRDFLQPYLSRKYLIKIFFAKLLNKLKKIF